MHMALSEISYTIFLTGFETPKPLKYWGVKNRCENSPLQQISEKG